MKKLIILLFVLLPLGLSAQEVKLAYVNASEVFVALPEMASVQKQMNDLNEQYQKDFNVMREEYAKKYETFMAQQDSLTENIKLRRMQELQDLEERMSNFAPVAQQDIQKRQEELLQPLQEKLHRAIQEVSQEQGYTYVFDAQAFLHVGSNAVDATPLVRAKLGLQ